MTSEAKDPAAVARRLVEAPTASVQFVLGSGDERLPVRRA